MKQELIEIGSVRKTHGTAGELKLVVYDGYEEDLEEAEFIFVGDSQNSAIPYQVLDLRGADFIISLEGLSNREDGASLRGKIVYLTTDTVTQRQDHDEQQVDAEFNRLVGFAIIDEELGELGMISAILSQPQNTLAQLLHDGQEKLIPLNANLIRGVDFTKKIVFMNLPAGLLDL